MRFPFERLALGASDGARQHPGRFGVLDRTHPLTQGLRFYTAFQELFGKPSALLSHFTANAHRDQVHGQQLVNNINVPFSTPFYSRTGAAMRWNGASNTGLYGPVVGEGYPQLDTITQEITVACKWRSLQNGAALVTKSAGNHLRDHFDLRTNAFTAGTSSSITASTTGNYADDLWHTAFGIWEGSSTARIAIIDENGELREFASQGGGDGPLVNTDERFAIGTLNTSFTTITGDIEWVGVWDRALALQECIALGGNPYLFFVSPTTKRWFFPLVQGQTVGVAGIEKGIAYNNFLFVMRDSSGNAKTGLVDSDFTKRITKDSGALANLTGTITEVGGGFYKLSAISASETNATFLGLKFRASGAIDTFITIKTNTSATDFGYQKNTTYSNWPFAMRQTNGDGVTGKTDGDFTVKTLTKDGAAPAALAGTITEIGEGFYKLSSLANTELNATFVGLRFVVPDAIESLYTIKTDVGV